MSSRIPEHVLDTWHAFWDDVWRVAFPCSRVEEVAVRQIAMSHRATAVEVGSRLPVVERGQASLAELIEQLGAFHAFVYVAEAFYDVAVGVRVRKLEVAAGLLIECRVLRLEPFALELDEPVAELLTQVERSFLLELLQQWRRRVDRCARHGWKLVQVYLRYEEIPRAP